jgi:hypothetical protein
MLRRLYGVLSKVRRDRISPRTPPSSFTDEEGRSILVRPYRDDDFHALAAMYDDFDPSQRAQGTPPLGAEAVRDWLSTLLDGVNVVAVHDDRVVGHVTFVPDDTDRHELAIFVHQEYQRGHRVRTPRLRRGPRGRGGRRVRLALGRDVEDRRAETLRQGRILLGQPDGSDPPHVPVPLIGIIVASHRFAGTLST